MHPPKDGMHSLSILLRNVSCGKITLLHLLCCSRNISAQLWGEPLSSERIQRSIFLLLLLVVFLWGINVVMLKYLTRYYPPFALVPIRLSLATLLLLPYIFFKHGYVRPPAKILPHIIGVATFSIFLHQTTMTWGIAHTSSTHAALILGLNPLFTTLLASQLVGEKFTPAKVFGILLGLCGVWLVVSGKEPGSATLIGDGVMFGATLTAVIGSLFVKKSTAVLPPLVVTAYSHLLASIALLIIGFKVNSQWSFPGAFETGPLATLLFSSFVNTALGALWWNTGIQKVGASTTSLFQNGIPVVGVFASAVLLGELLNWTHVAALLLVLTGVGFGTGLFHSGIVKKR